jgi:hypothetical protein
MRLKRPAERYIPPVNDRPIRPVRRSLLGEQWVAYLALALIVAFEILFHAGQIG